MLKSSRAERLLRASSVARFATSSEANRVNPFSSVEKVDLPKPIKPSFHESRYEKHVRMSGKRYDSAKTKPRSLSVSRRARYVGLPPPYPSGKVRAKALVSQFARRAEEIEKNHPDTKWTTTAAIVVERRPMLLPLPTELELREMEAKERWDPTMLLYAEDPRTLWKDQFERKLRTDMELPDWVWDVGSYFTDGRVGLTKPTREEFEFVFPDAKRQRLAAEALKKAQEDKKKREEEAAARAARGEVPVKDQVERVDGDDDDLVEVEEDVAQTDWAVQAAKSESQSAVKAFEPMSRTTLADETNNVESIFRKLDEKTYLVVRRKSDKKWEFPRTPELAKTALQDAAQDMLETQFTSSAETMFISNAPIGHTYDVVGGRDQASELFLQVNVLDPFEFGVDLFDKCEAYDEYAFATRDEILELYFEDDYDKQYFDGLLMPARYPVENRRLPDALADYKKDWSENFGDVAVERTKRLNEMLSSK